MYYSYLITREEEQEEEKAVGIIKQIEE